MKKGGLWMVLMVIAGLGLLIWHRPWTKPSEVIQPLRMAVDPWPGSAHVFLAEKKGFFKKNGVSVQLHMEKGPADSLVSYKNGGLDGVLDAVYPDVITLRALGYPIKIVYVNDFSQDGDVIIGRPELATLANLKGRRVSFETINSFSHIFVISALEKHGLDEMAVKFELVKAPDVLKALEEGRIDAGHTWQPTSSQALAKGYTILAKARDVPGIIIDLAFVDAKVVAQRPMEVQGLVRSLVEARQYMLDHKEESLALMANAVGMTVKEMSDGLDEIQRATWEDNRTALTRSGSPTSLFQSGENIIKFLVKRGGLRAIPNLDDLIDARFIQGLEVPTPLGKGPG